MARIRLRSGLLVMVEESVSEVMQKRERKLGLGFLPLAFVAPSSFMLFVYGIVTFLTLYSDWI